MDLRRAPAVPARARASRQGVEEDRKSDQDAHCGTDPHARSEVLPEDSEGEVERRPRGGGDGRQGEVGAEEEPRVRWRGREEKRRETEWKGTEAKRKKRERQNSYTHRRERQIEIEKQTRTEKRETDRAR